MALDHLDGFEHGVVSGTGSLYTDWQAGTASSITTPVYTAGGRAVDLSNTANITKTLSSDSTVAVNAVALRFPVAPSAGAECLTLEMVSGDSLFLRLNTDLTVSLCSWTGVVTVHATTVTTYAVDTWHWLSLAADVSANPWVAKWAIDGVAQADQAPAFGAESVHKFKIGWGGSSSSDHLLYDDWVGYRGSLADHPVAEKNIKAYSPTGVGTHNLDAATSQFFFKNVGGTESALTTSESTSYQAIDEVPIGSDADRVLVKTATTTTSGQSASGATTASSVSGTWTSITNAQGAPQNAVGAAYATTNAASSAPGKNGSAVMAATGFGLSGTVTALTVNVRAGASATGVTGETIQIDLYDGTTLITSGTAQTINQTAYKDWSQSFSSVSVAASTLTIRVTVSRGNTNTSYTAAIDAVALSAVTTQTSSQPSATNYLEFALADSVESSAPVAVRAILAQRNDSGTTANTISAKLHANATDGAIVTDLNLGTASSRYDTALFATAPGGATWTTSLFNGATLRWGYTADADSTPRLEAALVEALFPTAPAGTTDTASQGVTVAAGFAPSAKALSATGQTAAAASSPVPHATAAQGVAAAAGSAPQARATVALGVAAAATISPTARTVVPLGTAAGTATAPATRGQVSLGVAAGVGLPPTPAAAAPVVQGVAPAVGRAPAATCAAGRGVASAGATVPAAATTISLGVATALGHSPASALSAITGAATAVGTAPNVDVPVPTGTATTIGFQLGDGRIDTPILGVARAIGSAPSAAVVSSRGVTTTVGASPAATVIFVLGVATGTGFVPTEPIVPQTPIPGVATTIGIAPTGSVTSPTGGALTAGVTFTAITTATTGVATVVPGAWSVAATVTGGLAATVGFEPNRAQPPPIPAGHIVLPDTGELVGSPAGHPRSPRHGTTRHPTTGAIR